MSGLLRRAVRQAARSPHLPRQSFGGALYHRQPIIYSAPVYIQQRNNGGKGFIKEIMNQVNQELSKDKKFQDAKKNLDSSGFTESAEKLAQAAKEQEEK